MDERAEPIARGTVARGRCLEIPTGERAIVATASDGTPVYAMRCKRVGPGTEVELPNDELESLRRLGFILPEGAPPELTEAETRAFAQLSQSGGRSPGSAGPSVRKA